MPAGPPVNPEHKEGLPVELDALCALIAEQLDVNADDLTEDTDLLDDLGVDSMDAVELIVAVESATDIRIPDDAADHIRTIGDIISYLAEHAEPEE